ncbi:hypothetical protein C8R45DRAFT_972719, partial [Mycena sanguinolenta]
RPTMEMEPIPSSSRTNHDAKSISSGSTTPPAPLLAPPPAPIRPTAQADDVTCYEEQNVCKGFGSISFISWAASIAACFVRYFSLVHSADSGSDLLAWIACSAAFLIFIPIFFVSALMRRPSKKYLGVLRYLVISMTGISIMIACGALPALGGDSGIQAGLSTCIVVAILTSISLAFGIHCFWEGL